MFYRLGKYQKNLLVGGLHQPPPPLELIQYGRRIGEKVYQIWNHNRSGNRNLNRNYSNWSQDLNRIGEQKLESEPDQAMRTMSSADFHYVSDNKALKPIYFRDHLTNSSVAVVLQPKVSCSPAGDEISNPDLNCTIVPLHHLFITQICISVESLSQYVCAHSFILCACIIYLFIYLFI